MEKPTMLTPSAPRLAPMLHARSASRSPTRSTSRSASRSHRISDDLLSDLTPATTLEAFTNPSGKLKSSIEAASPADRAFGIRATLAAKKVQQWLEELSDWPWPAGKGSVGFEVPDARRKNSPSTGSDIQNEPEEEKKADTNPKYCGSLLVEEVRRYEHRIDLIASDMDDLKVEEIKRQVLDTHFSATSRPSSSASTITMPSFLTSYTVLDDFTAIVTATVLQALPNLAKLTRLMDIWSIRLSVLRRVPYLLSGLEDAEMALKTGWDTIKTSGEDVGQSGGKGESVLTRKAFDIMKGVLQAKVTILGRDLDHMLDILEGRMDTLPENWLDRMEKIERDYGDWVVMADRKITEGELAADSRARKAEKAAQRASEAEACAKALEVDRKTLLDEEKRIEVSVDDVSYKQRELPMNEDGTELESECAAQTSMHSANPDAEAKESGAIQDKMESQGSTDANLLAHGVAKAPSDHGDMQIQTPRIDGQTASADQSMLSTLAIGAAGAAAAAYLLSRVSRDGSGSPEYSLVPEPASNTGSNSSIHQKSDESASNTVTPSFTNVGEPITPLGQLPANTASQLLSTPNPCSSQVEEQDTSISTGLNTPFPPQRPFAETQPLRESTSTSLVDNGSLDRSSSVKNITKTPKFGHAVANALRRSVVTEEEPDCNEATTCKPIEAPSETSLTANRSFPQSNIKSPDVSTEPIAGASQSCEGVSDPNAVTGPPASTIVLAEQLGLTSTTLDNSSGSSRSPGTDVKPQFISTSEDSMLKMLSPIKEHHPSIKNKESFATMEDETETIAGPEFLPRLEGVDRYITGSDGAYESTQRFDSEEMDLDLMDHHRLPDARRPSIMVDSVHEDTRRDSIDSEGSITSRSQLAEASIFPSSPADQDSDSGSALAFEDSPLPPRKWPRDLQDYDKTPPGSPPGVPTRAAQRPRQLLDSPDFSNVGISHEDASLLEDINVVQSIPGSPVSSSSDDQMQQQISSLLQSIPAQIRLRSKPEDKSHNDKLRPRKVRRSVTPSIRSQSSTGSLRAPTPSFTLAPAYAKNTTPRHRPQNGNPEIKVYHLSRSSGEAPIKLFVRLVGENGERVMVRVGGGWADLGEYLKEYALHHGRRAQVDNDKVEIQDLPPRVPSGRMTPGPRSTSGTGPSGRTTPGPPRSASAMGSRPSTAYDRPKTSLGIRSGRRMSTVTPIGAPPLPTTPFTAGRIDSQTPPSAASRSSSRMSWNDDEEGSSQVLGLAGPRGKNKELEEKDREWVESMKEKVKMASAEKEKEKEKRPGTSGHRQSLGEMDKVGATKRLFRKTSKLEL